MLNKLFNYYRAGEIFWYCLLAVPGIIHYISSNPYIINAILNQKNDVRAEHYVLVFYLTQRLKNKKFQKSCGKKRWTILRYMLKCSCIELNISYVTRLQS